MSAPFARNQLVVCIGEGPLWRSEHDNSIVHGPRAGEICTVWACTHERPRLFAKRHWYVMLVGYGLGEYLADNFRPIEENLDHMGIVEGVKKPEEVRG